MSRRRRLERSQRFSFLHFCKFILLESALFLTFIDQTAYFKLPENVRHGQGLICSFPACRDRGIKFLYCIYCRDPVAKRKVHVARGTSGVLCSLSVFFGRKVLVFVANFSCYAIFPSLYQLLNWHIE